MKQHRRSCSFVAHSLLVLLMSLIALAVLLTGFLPGAAESMGGRAGGESPPAPTSSDGHHEASSSPDHSMLPKPAGKG
ncbi:hypothetical protein ACP4OV_021886 [Aristida adscensionis]